MATTNKLEAWADKSDEDAARTVSSLVTTLRRDQEWRHQRRILLGTLYGEETSRSMSGIADESTGPPHTLSLNICRTMVDAATARIAARNPPKPTFTTEGATHAEREQARIMDRGLDGIFYLQKAKPKALRTFRSALIYGDAALMVDTWDGMPRISRALPGDLIVDERECDYGEPCRLYSRRRVDRAVLAATFPHLRAEIMDANGEISMEYQDWGYDPADDQLVVTEGWSLPTMRGADDGRYIATLGDLPLESFKWKRPRFPIARYVWDEPERGWYGTGLVWELMGLQLEINDLLDRICDAQRYVAGFWAVERSSGIDPKSMNDERDRVLVYVGTEPKYITPSAIPEQMYRHLWEMYDKAFQISGISQVSASSQKPAGLVSGAALRAYRDDQSERFLHKSGAYEEFHCDLGRCVVDELGDLASVGNVPIRSVTGGELRTIDWKEASLPEKAFELQVLPSSGVPNTPAALIEFAEDLGKLQVFEPRQLAAILGKGIPDIESLVFEANANEELVKKMFAKIADEGVYESPEPQMKLDEAITVAQNAFLDYRRRGVDPARMDLMARWIVAATKMFKDSQPPAPAPAGAPPAAMGPAPLGPGGP